MPPQPTLASVCSPECPLDPSPAPHAVHAPCAAGVLATTMTRRGSKAFELRSLGPAVDQPPARGFVVGFFPAVMGITQFSAVDDSHGGWPLSFSTAFGASIGAQLVIVTCGTIWLSYLYRLGAREALAKGMWPYLIGLLLKSLAAAAIVTLLGRIDKAALCQQTPSLPCNRNVELPHGASLLV